MKTLDADSLLHAVVDLSRSIRFAEFSKTLDRTIQTYIRTQLKERMFISKEQIECLFTDRGLLLGALSQGDEELTIPESLLAIGVTADMLTNITISEASLLQHFIESLKNKEE